MNYWPLKRSITVLVVISTRTMDGTLVKRERISFATGQVCNYEPAKNGIREGSVEIEIFAAENIVIPYAAIVAWYETAKGISQVHSYARAYSMHEVEEGRTHSIGREACWTISDTVATRSFCVFHNGPFARPAQTFRLSVTNAAGKKQQIAWDSKPLAPYESVRVQPRDRLPGLSDFLDGGLGQAEIDFELGGAFTRMLVGNERLDGQDLQVTHSNFNYTTQRTDSVEVGAAGWMVVPAMQRVSSMEVVVYPQSVTGNYHLDDGGDLRKEWRTGEPLAFPLRTQSTLRFTSADDAPFPTRLVTSIRIQQSPERIPNECSLGVLTSLQPAKRLWWGAIRCDQGATSLLVIHDLPEIYQGIGAGDSLSFRLYSAFSQTPLERNFPAASLKQLVSGMSVREIWPEAEAFLQGQPGYYTMFCPYGGLTVYSLTENQHGSLCIEHGF